MRLKKRSIAVVVLVATAALLNLNQAYALNDDEAAVLMGLAVGGIAAYAVKHHREHDRNGWNVTSRYQPRYSPPARTHFNYGHHQSRHKHHHKGYNNAHQKGRYYGHAPRIVERHVVYYSGGHHRSKDYGHRGGEHRGQGNPHHKGGRRDHR